MCEPRDLSFHYEIRNVGKCLENKEFESVTKALRAVATEAAKWGADYPGSVLDIPHIFPGHYGEIVKVTTEVRKEIIRKVI